MSNWLQAPALGSVASGAPLFPLQRRRKARAQQACACRACSGEREEEEFGGIADTMWLTTQIASGQRDANQLTNGVFWLRHPELKGQKIRADQRDLANEWLVILRDLVKPALARVGASSPAPSGDVAAALKLSAKVVPGLGITLRALLERNRAQYAPDLPIEVLLAFAYREAGNRTFADATSGHTDRQNGNYVPVPTFFELGVFQTPAGEHGCKPNPLNPKAKVCAYQAPGSNVAASEFGKGWQHFTGQLPNSSNWQDPEMQVRIGLRSLTSTAERLRAEFPKLFTSKSSEWYVRMPVLYSFSRGADWTRAFLRTYGVQLAQLPEAQRWNFLKGKSATRSNGAKDVFRPDNVDDKMSLAAQLRAAAAGSASTSGSAPGNTPSPAPSTPSPTPRAPAPSTSAPTNAAKPAPGTVETRRSYPTSPPLTNPAGKRSAANYDAVLDQFAVGVNPRYAHRNGATFCNIFAWDVTRAMGAEIPHWVDKSGNPTLHTSKLGNELNANALNTWLHKHGARFGWRQVAVAEAAARANAGFPSVASHNKVGGIGHIAMIRPGDVSPTLGPWMAQAGATNSNRIRLYGVWKRSTPVEFWTHD